MRKRVVSTSLVCVLIMGVVVELGAQTPKDMDDYIAEIRKTGMSEMARAHVRTVAGILAGTTLLEYRTDPANGRYWPSYRSTTCPNPNAGPDEVDEWTQLRLSEAAQLTLALQPFADFDGSGFVSSSEGYDFRRLFEFGCLVVKVKEEEGPIPEAIARASGMDVDEIEERIAEYEALSVKIALAGATRFPSIALDGE